MGFFEGLSKMRQVVGARLAALADRVVRRDPEALRDMEEFLLTADFGPGLAKRMMEETRKVLSSSDSAELGAVKRRLGEVLMESLRIPSASDTVARPYVIFMVGPHGAGKTTTVGRLAHRFAREGKSVVLAAGDTHRAAAIEQVRQWATKAGDEPGSGGRVTCVAQQPEADPAAVIFDAIAHARQSGFDVVIADTAGRIHTRLPLMESLQKTRRAIEKALPGAPHETLLVMDATLGQNALVVARSFSQAVPVTGLVLTKMDGTAKGGAVFALCRELKLPVKYVGLGEGTEDLVPFEVESFVSSLLA